MNRKRKIIRNLLIILICYVLSFSSYLHLTPNLAHKASEKSNHYGPSDVVYKTDYAKGKYYLSRYGDYFSCDIINRSFGFFWECRPNYQKIDPSSPVSTYWRMYDYNYWIYFGVITDPSIAYLEFTYSSLKEPIVQNTFYDGMFLFHWESDTQNVTYHLKAYDIHDNLIYEDDKE